MKSGAVISLALALCGIAAGEQVRVILQVVEVPHAALTKWTTGETLPGREIHDRAMKLVENGEAEVVETCVLVARSGERALAETISERIYPTETEPSSLPGTLPQSGLANGQFPAIRPFRPAGYTAFETRNAGSTLSIEPMVEPESGKLDVRMELEMVDRAALIQWGEFKDQWGDAAVRMPVFDTQRMISSVALTSGVFDLWNVFTPKPAAVPAAATKQLVFVRADLVPILVNP
jgi:hypothetical protein